MHLIQADIKIKHSIQKERQQRELTTITHTEKQYHGRKL